MAGSAPLRPLGWRAPEKVFIEASLRVLIETSETEDGGSGVRLPKRIESPLGDDVP